MACPYAGHVNVAPSKPKTLMKGALISKHGGTDVIHFKTDLPVPSPEANQVLVKVFTVGVNPVDVYLRKGIFPSGPKPPYIPGGDVAGIVDSFGGDVTKFTRGQRVFVMMGSPNITGGCADYMVVDQHYVFPLHDNCSSSQGAAIGLPYFTAYKALFHKGKAKPGESVLVHGASGGVGIAACQIARAHGMTVLGTAGTEGGMELVKNNGAHAVFNHKETNHPQKIKDYAGEKGVDLIMEMLASENLNHDLDIIAQNGRILVVGTNPSVTINTNPIVMMSKQCCVQGTGWFSQSELAEIGVAVCSGIEQGYIKPVIAEEYPLTETSLAQTEVMEHKQGTKGKIIISLN